MLNSEMYLRQADTEELKAELRKGSYHILNTCWIALAGASLLLGFYMYEPSPSLLRLAFGVYVGFSLWAFWRLRKKIIELIAARVEKERILAYVEEKKKQLEDTNISLKEAQIVADAANKAKSQFLARVSHELRTPLNAILGMNEIAMEITKEEEVLECLKEVKYAASGFLDLINEILDISKIEAGKIEVLNEAFSHKNLIQHIISLVGALSHGKKVIFEAEIEDDIPQYLYGDAVKIRQVLVNLLGNAVKYTPGSSNVKLEIKREGYVEEEGKVSLRYTVKDSGVGINKYLKANLVKSLLENDPAQAFGISGGGLGLSISAHLISMMGGNFDFESEEGQGSEFFFTLTYKMADQNNVAELDLALPVEALSSTRLPGELRVLIAEDNLINKKVIERILQGYGLHSLEFAANGAEALLKYKTGDFDLILMDCQMPVMDGYMAAQTIRSEEDTSTRSHHIPIIAVTAQAMVGDRERCLEAGMDDVVTKPIDKKELLSTIKKYAEQVQSEREESEDTAQANQVSSC